jgi:hypothetical protein
MNAILTPGQVSTTQLTTLAVFDDLRDRKSIDLREVGRGGGDRTTSDVEDVQVTDSIKREKR